MSTIGKSIKELHKNGFSKKQIKRELGCSSQTICAYLNHERTELGNKIVKLRETGLSMGLIADKLNISKSTVSRWCKTIKNNDKISKNNRTKSNKSRKPKTKKRVKYGRDNTKLKTVKSKYNKSIREKRKKFALMIGDNKCAICGFDKTQALCFHHKDPSTKSFSLSSSKISRVKIDIFIDEVEKCVLLCHNCHSLVESGDLECNVDTLKCNIPIPDDLKLENSSIKLTSELIEKENGWINKRKKISLKKLKPKRLNVDFDKLSMSTINIFDANRMLIDYHYMGPIFKPSICILGLFFDNELIGSAVITSPVRKSSIKNACEISRFVLSVKCKNLASSFLSKIIKHIKENYKYKNIVSFAENDTHAGTIYKAANFRIVGGSYKTYNYDGINKKTIYERARIYGITEHEYAEKFNLNRIIENPKTKFVYSIR